MSDPFGVLPLAASSGGGKVDGHDAAALAAAGLTLLRRSAPLVRVLSGRRAGILLPTSHRFFTALAAAEGRGSVLLNPLCSAHEIAAQIEDADVGAVFTISALVSRLPPRVTYVLLDDAPRAAVVTSGGDSRSIALTDHEGLSLEGDPDTPGRDEEAAIVYTSAMAGRPLGAILTHRGLLANARATAVAAGNVAEDHVLALLPYAHLFGLVVSGIAPLLRGARLTTVDRFSPGQALELIGSEGITELVGVPAIYQALLVAAERSGTSLKRHTLRLCICGGAPLDPELEDRWLEATGVELRQGYGLTEAGPVCLFNRVDRPSRRGSMGIPLPGVEVTIREPDGDGELPDGRVGEICVRGENVFAGYVSHGELGLCIQAGWLRTGDAGVRNEDGSFEFRGVLKPMFTRNGFNIYPREIERAVAELDGVGAARVTGFPDHGHEWSIVADVEGEVTQDQIARWCRTRLAAYKQPQTIRLRSR